MEGDQMSALRVGQALQAVVGVRLFRRRQTTECQAVVQRRRFVRGWFVWRRGLLRRRETPALS
jgi:hypothetical protein